MAVTGSSGFERIMVQIYKPDPRSKAGGIVLETDVHGTDLEKPTER